MKIIKYISIISTIFLLLACENKQERWFNDSNKETVINDVKKMFDNFHNDIKARGLTAEFKYLDSSKDFFWVIPGYNTAISYDSVKSILEANAGGFSFVEFHWDTVQVFPLSDKIAAYTGVVGGMMIDTSGNNYPVNIIESGTVIKRKDGWKILSGQSANLTNQ